jgi:hypothetical protein
MMLMIRKQNFVLITFMSWLSLVFITGCQLDFSLQAQSESNKADILPTAVRAYRDFSPTPDSPVRERIREIYVYGQTLGNHHDVFTVVGDSISVSASFLQAVGERREVLGEYAFLEDTIAHYRDGRINSFARRSQSAGVGWAAWGVLSPDLASTSCQVGESPLLCEYRQSRPSVAIIMFGTNDAGYRTAEQYRADLTRIIDITLQRGIIPVLSTPPPRPDTPEMIQSYRQVVMSLGDVYELPVIDYFTWMQELPQMGLAFDNIHPSTPAQGYEASAIFDGSYLQYGYVARNLAVLLSLHEVLHVVQSE